MKNVLRKKNDRKIVISSSRQKSSINFCVSWKLTVLITVIFFILVWWFGDFSGGKKIILGVTFSQPYAQYLNTDWKANYLALLNDLSVKNLRLVAYWDTIEKVPGEYDFTDLDWQIAEAREHHANVILAIGRKLPRWPECVIPSYLSKEPEAVQNMALTRLLKAIVGHYKSESSIVMWQVENEPFIEWFGSCPVFDRSFVDKEVKLVDELDNRPVMITDSGELGWWSKEGKLGNYFGTTMYQVIWNKNFGYLNYYFFRPSIYHLKALLSGINPRRVLVAELQAESWFPDGNKNISLDEQRKSMNPDQLRANVELARRTGFGGAYLWGAEYWYWLKMQGDNTMWDAAKALFKM